MKIGIISDTHGLLRPEVLSALNGCEAILHAGDVCRQEILDELEKIAPVYVVRGNNDKEWAENIPVLLDFEIAGLRVFMTHKKTDLPRTIFLRMIWWYSVILTNMRNLIEEKRFCSIPAAAVPDDSISLLRLRYWKL